MHGHVVPVVQHPQCRRRTVCLTLSRAPEGVLTEPYDMEQAVQQAGLTARGDDGGPVGPLEDEPLCAEFTDTGRATGATGTSETRTGITGSTRLHHPQHKVVRGRGARFASVPYDHLAAELKAGVSHFIAHRVDQRARAIDQRPPTAHRPEGLRRQPGGVDPLGQDGHGERHGPSGWSGLA